MIMLPVRDSRNTGPLGAAAPGIPALQRGGRWAKLRRRKRCGSIGCPDALTHSAPRRFLVFATPLTTGWPALAQSAQLAPPLQNETPATFTPRVDTFDYVERQVMIPMRDGVKLKTVI